MAVYTIKDLEKLCGIKAHTIRMWEQRYGLVIPNRTQTNIRYYEEDDLKDLLDIATLNKNGFKISHIAKMTKAEIRQEVSNLSVINFESDAQLNTLLMAMMEMDEEKFDYVLTKSSKEKGFEATMLELVFPFLEKLSVLWITGSVSPVQENFITCLFRQKMMTAIDRIPLTKCRCAARLLLFLPEGEDQELSMLLMQYLARLRGLKATYLGLNVSLIDLQDAYNICRPTHLFTMISERFDRQPVQKYIDQLAAHFSDCQVWLSGYQVVAQPVVCPENVVILPGLSDTINALNQLSQH